MTGVPLVQPWQHNPGLYDYARKREDLVGSFTINTRTQAVLTFPYRSGTWYTPRRRESV